MRKIVFRGKTSNNKWIYGNLTIIDDTYFVSDEKHNKHIVRPETVGQYTGLTDKNGKKIFEGDIVKFGEYTYYVEWKQDRCGFGYGGRADRMLEIDGKHCEVVGNIHDNPELLKGGK